MRIEIYYRTEESREAAVIKAFCMSVCRDVPLELFAREDEHT